MNHVVKSVPCQLVKLCSSLLFFNLFTFHFIFFIISLSCTVPLISFFFFLFFRILYSSTNINVPCLHIKKHTPRAPSDGWLQSVSQLFHWEVSNKTRLVVVSPTFCMHTEFLHLVFFFSSLHNPTQLTGRYTYAWMYTRSIFTHSTTNKMLPVPNKMHTECNEA